MTVPYAGVQAQIINLAAGLFADSAAFRTLVGAVDAAEARTKIVEIDDAPPVGAHAAVQMPDIEWDRASTSHILGSATVDVVVMFPPSDGLTETESFRDALNTTSAISREINDQIASSGYELVQGVMLSTPSKLDDSEELAGWFSCMFTFSVLCMP
jgi:hypothetical protein